MSTEPSGVFADGDYAFLVETDSELAEGEWYFRSNEPRP